jgi:microcompartment protein CcmL/EutN
MPGYALGLIETEGLPAAIEATDAALKSANIRLIGYELATGGIVTVKVEGEVSAVDTAVRSGSVAASRINRLKSVHVIPRPSNDLNRIVRSKDTVGTKAHGIRVAEDEPATDIPGPAAETVDAAGHAEVKDEGIPEEDAEQAVSTDYESLKETNGGAEPNAVSEKEEAIETGPNVDDQQVVAAIETETDIAGDQAEPSEEETTADEQEPIDEDAQDNKELEYTCNLCHDPLCGRSKGQPKASCIHYEKS